MKIEKFEDIISWKKAMQLAVLVYDLFGHIKDFSFSDQIKRASISIGNNIVEGFERKSNSEFKYFLYIAKGSCGEVRSMGYLALKFRYISQDDFEKVSGLSLEVSKLLSGFIKTL